MNKWKILPPLLLSFFSNTTSFAEPCSFDSSKNCSLQLDLLNDKSANNLFYYSPTNYDHRISGEINVYDVNMVKKELSGGLTLLAELINPGFWRSGEMMTRADLTSPPFNSPLPSEPWTTKSTTHGYLEVNVKLPTCIASTDGLCQKGENPIEYNQGLWPAIWMMPTYDANWPQNGEFDIMEAYLRGTAFDITTAALHFFGNDPACGNNDCQGWGLSLDYRRFPEIVFKQAHTWGYEWERDPQSKIGGYIMTGYIDNHKVWGPLRTDTLPADGSNALSRGFNDANGGYYLIINLAVGGPYAGDPHPQMQKASMHVNSVKIYNVNSSTPPVEACFSPANITSTYTDNKKSVTLNWNAPNGGAPVQKYIIKDWQKNILWQGSSLSWTDNSLPGQSGKYTYYLSSVCANNESVDVQYDVIIPETSVCNAPTNIQATWSSDRRKINLTWTAPSAGLPVKKYEVRNWQKQLMWQGNKYAYTDKSLPGTPGKFTYYLDSICGDKTSILVQKDVLLN